MDSASVNLFHRVFVYRFYRWVTPAIRLRARKRAQNLTPGLISEQARCLWPY